MGSKPIIIHGVWNMNKLRLLGAMCATSLVFSMPSQAATFDFSLGALGDLNTNTYADPSGVIAESFYWNSGTGTWDDADLYRRNQTNDHGFGVCSPSETGCQGGTGPNDGGGDVNELSNQLAFEVIRLDKGNYAAWSELWVSSLDSSEVGTLYWGGDGSIDALLAGPNFTYMAGVDIFSASVEGNILDYVTAGGFNASAQYVLFTPGSPFVNGVEIGACISTVGCYEPPTGDDNDYLVYKGAVVPVPAAVWLFGSGLLGLVGIARRKKAA